jgi:hypothetical protein
MRAYLSTRVCLFATLVLLIGGVRTVSGSVITFSGLAGPTDSPYGGSTEAGFTVTPISGSWFQGLLYGNPAPSIYDGPLFGPGTGAIQVTDGASSFTFSSLDYSSNNGTSTFLIQGFQGASMVFSDSGTLTASVSPGFGFSALASAHSSTLVDRLVIQVAPGNGVTSINLDNINVPASTVPEPGTFLSLGVALCTLSLMVGKLKKRNS